MQAVGHLESSLTIPRIRWGAAVKSGLICGAVLLIIPQGIPWAGFGSLSPVVMGRAVDPLGVDLFVAIPMHLSLAVIYALAVAAIVRFFRNWKGILCGGAAGVALYIFNLGLMALIVPRAIGSEVQPFFTHVIFGLFSAAIYKGMTREPAKKPARDGPLK